MSIPILLTLTPNKQKEESKPSFNEDVVDIISRYNKASMSFLLIA